MALDTKKIKKQLEDLDDGRDAGRGKLTQNLDALKGIILLLETSEENEEVSTQHQPSETLS